MVMIVIIITTTTTTTTIITNFLLMSGRYPSNTRSTQRGWPRGWCRVGRGGQRRGSGHCPGYISTSPYSCCWAWSPHCTCPPSSYGPGWSGQSGHGFQGFLGNFQFLFIYLLLLLLLLLFIYLFILFYFYFILFLFLFFQLLDIVIYAVLKIVYILMPHA